LNEGCGITPEDNKDAFDYLILKVVATAQGVDVKNSLDPSVLMIDNLRDVYPSMRMLVQGNPWVF